MPKWLRALIAAYGAKKLGGGCLSTIVLFVVIYYALGTCNRAPVKQGYQPTHTSKAVLTVASGTDRTQLEALSFVK
jgi:hypothetical protein